MLLASCHEPSLKESFQGVKSVWTINTEKDRMAHINNN